MKTIAVIVAAGSGMRMGNPIPKQFLELAGKAVFLHSVEAFLRAYPEIKIILVVHAGYHLKAKALMENAGYSSCAAIITGGTTRSDSVNLGLKTADEESIVFVHDAARCLVSTELIRKCYATALEHGSAIPVVRVADSVRKITGTGSEPVDRDDLRLVQTPQVFRTKLLKEAYRQADGREFADDAAVLEHAGIPVTLTEGDPMNIKITRPADLEIAAALLKHLNA